MQGHGKLTTSGQVRGPSRRSFDYIDLGVADEKDRTSRKTEGEGERNELGEFLSCEEDFDRGQYVIFRSIL